MASLTLSPQFVWYSRVSRYGLLEEYSQSKIFDVQKELLLLLTQKKKYITKCFVKM